MSWTGSETARKTQRQLDAGRSFSSPKYRDPISKAPIASTPAPTRKKPQNRYAVAPGTECLVKRTSDADDAWRKHTTTKFLRFQGHVSMERDTITLCQGDWLLRVPRRMLVGTPVKLWRKPKNRRRKR